VRRDGTFLYSAIPMHYVEVLGFLYEMLYTTQPSSGARIVCTDFAVKNGRWLKPSTERESLRHIKRKRISRCARNDETFFELKKRAES